MALANPGIHETNVRMGLDNPLPDFVGVIQEARYWNVSPMEILEWPLEWITNGQILREAEHKAREMKGG